MMSVELKTKRESLISELAWAQGLNEGFRMAIQQIQQRASQAIAALDAEETTHGKAEGLPVHPSMQADGQKGGN